MHEQQWRSQRLCVEADPSAESARIEAMMAPSGVGSRPCRSVVSTPSGIRAKPRPQTHSLHIDVGLRNASRGKKNVIFLPNVSA